MSITYTEFQILGSALIAARRIALEHGTNYDIADVEAAWQWYHVQSVVPDPVGVTLPIGHQEPDDFKVSK